MKKTKIDFNKYFFCNLLSLFILHVIQIILNLSMNYTAEQLIDFNFKFLITISIFYLIINFDLRNV